MPGSTREKAYEAFREPIQDALTCFLDGRVARVGGRFPGPGKIGLINLNGGEETVLFGDSRVRITFAKQFRIDEADGKSGPWKVFTTNYIYNLIEHDGSAIVKYHWHPDDDAPKHPHLHVPGDRSKLHHPTGRVLIEDVLQFATELGAVPRDPGKWETIYERNLENFAKSASWGLPLSVKARQWLRR